MLVFKHFPNLCLQLLLVLQYLLVVAVHLVYQDIILLEKLVYLVIQVSDVLFGSSVVAFEV